MAWSQFAVSSLFAEYAIGSFFPFELGDGLTKPHLQAPSFFIGESLICHRSSPRVAAMQLCDLVNLIAGFGRRCHFVSAGTWNVGLACPAIRATMPSYCNCRCGFSGGKGVV